MFDDNTPSLPEQEGAMMDTAPYRVQVLSDAFCFGLIDKTFAVTRFPRQTASRKTELNLSLRSLAEMILQHEASEKAKLPWYKLARFGDKKSLKGCLRTNENVLGITGVEADYDAGIIQPAEAAQMLADEGIACLIYTSARHTAEHPKWRIFAHTSKELSPDERHDCTARLDAILGGVLDKASYTLSQSYYAGSVTGNAPVKAILVDGYMHIDHATHIDIPEQPMRDVGKVSGEPTGLTQEQFTEAVMSIENDRRFEDRNEWLKILSSIKHEFLAAGWDLAEAAELAHEWSATWDGGYDPEATDHAWDSIVTPRSTGASVLHFARQGGWCQMIDVDNDFTGEDVDVSAEEAPSEKKVVDQLEQMNRKHAVAMIAGRTLVLTEQKGGRVDFSNVTDLNNFYANNRVMRGKTDEPISAWWMRQPKRRTYAGGIVFSPGKQVPKDTFNLWTGFAVEPDPNASCELFLRHVREVVCSGRQDEYQYVMGWLAHMIQRPEEKPGVALILIGEKGVGKDTVGEYVGKLFPKHHTKLSNMEQLVGKFNAHIEKTLLLHVEEGIWAGDKSAHGPLQSLITSPIVMIERKGIDAIQMPSVLRLMITSNEKWVVPATRDERRYAVFNVANSHRRNHTYFDALYRERDNGGLAALLHVLQTWDITGFNPRAFPETDALVQQKIQGLKGVPAFWFDLLESGRLPINVSLHDAKPGEWSEQEATIATDVLYHAYCDWYKDRKGQGHGTLFGTHAFGKELKVMCPRRKETKIGKKPAQRRAYKLPPIEQCRAEFSTLFGAVKWPVDEEEDNCDWEDLL